MTSINLAIEKAVEAGYKLDACICAFCDKENYERIFLDPQFWKCLGKSLGWKEKKFYQFDVVHEWNGQYMEEARWYSRCFWNHIWDGGDPESFFKEILK